jgi:peptidoglycan/LPS O-acetylase OafA/YrhL
MLIDRGGELFFSLHAIEQPPTAVQFTIIVPAWTLSLELAFYLIAPFILRRHFLLIAGIALVSYTFRFSAYAHGYRSLATEYRFFPFELSLFLYGALSYRLYAFFKERDMFEPALSLAITVACALTAISLPKYFSQHQYQMYALVGLLLPSLFDFSTRHRWDKWLGDLSYPLYLVHWSFCVIGLVIFNRYWSGDASSRAVCAYLVAISSVGCAVAVNRFLVSPIDKWRQARARVSTIFTHASRGRGASTPNKAGGSPVWTHFQNFFSAVSRRCW